METDKLTISQKKAILSRALCHIFRLLEEELLEDCLSQKNIIISSFIKKYNGQLELKITASPASAFPDISEMIIKNKLHLFFEKIFSKIKYSIKYKIIYQKKENHIIKIII